MRNLAMDLAISQEQQQQVAQVGAQQQRVLTGGPGGATSFRRSSQCQKTLTVAKDRLRQKRPNAHHVDSYVCASALKLRYSLLDERLCDLVVAVKRPGLGGQFDQTPLGSINEQLPGWAELRGLSGQTRPLPQESGL